MSAPDARVRQRLPTQQEHRASLPGPQPVALRLPLHARLPGATAQAPESRHGPAQRHLRAHRQRGDFQYSSESRAGSVQALLAETAPGSNLERRL